VAALSDGDPVVAEAAAWGLGCSRHRSRRGLDMPVKPQNVERNPSGDVESGEGGAGAD